MSPTGLIAPIFSVDRPQLRQQLDQGLAHPLALVVAPAGSGKSVLLTQWAMARSDLQFVWLELSPLENDSVRFCSRLLQGLSDIGPSLTSLEPLVALNGGGLGRALMEELATELADYPEVVIVLDDLHRLSNATLVTDLGLLVELLPPNVTMVLSSRIDLPLAWSRHRLRRDVIEIRQSDLAFDHADSQELLNHIAGRPLSADNVSALVTRTEGWATGLQLAAMTLKMQSDSDEFVVHFSGDDRLIADYLSVEVLQGQSELRREILVILSVLDELTAEIVTHLTGIPNAQAILEELERESMFLIPLDTRRSRYRFHHLFRDMLRHQLRAAEPGREAELSNAAAHWYLEHGDLGLAVDALLRAKNWEVALNVVMAQGHKFYKEGQMATVIRWIEQVPDHIIADRRDVLLSLGFLRGVEGQTASADALFRRVIADSRASAGERACATCFMAAQVQWRSRPEITIDLAPRALQLLDHLEGDPLPDIMDLADLESLETLTITSGGRAQFLMGDMGPARTELERALVSGGPTFFMWTIGTLASLAQLEAWCGHIERAQALANEALSVASSVGVLSHPIDADAFLATTFASLERGEPHRAALSLHEATLRVNANRRGQLQWICHLARALVQEAEAQRSESAATINLPRHDIEVAPPPIVSQGILALRIRQLRLNGDLEYARRLGTGISEATSPVLFEIAATALLAGRSDEARKCLEGMYIDAEPTTPIESVHRDILAAWIAHHEERYLEATQAMTAAVDVGERNELVEIFVRVGPPIVDLLASLSTERPVWRQVILDRFRQVTQVTPGAGLLDPLTNRELEVLSHLPSRMSNLELAEHCFVSHNTIKSHIAHIYQKLEVTSRGEAVTRGQQLGLI